MLNEAIGHCGRGQSEGGKVASASAPKGPRGEFVQSSNAERDGNQRLAEFARDFAGRPDFIWSSNAHLLMKRQTISRVLYYDSLYRSLVGTPGVICEFGVQWGATMALLANLRGIHEPFNHSRRIIGFDTFRGFTTVRPEDGELVESGSYAVSEGYEVTLEQLLTLHESFSPIPHMRKFEIVKGDASSTVPAWLDANPQAIVGMAIFDMDVYQPTRDALTAIRPRLTKGSILVFDELNHHLFPGETVAVAEVLGLGSLRLRHDPHQPNCAWAIWGE